jgi:hypothetical protein
MRYVYRLALYFLLALSATWFLAGYLAGRASAHDIYTDWKQDNGASCCNERHEHDGHVTGDCRRVKARALGNGLWSVMVDGQEVIVPPDKVLKIPSPDMSSHWCGMGSVTFCFVPAPEGM